MVDLFDDFDDDLSGGRFEGEAEEEFFEEDQYENHLEHIEETKTRLSHEAVNLYAHMGIFLPYPAPTWYAVRDKKIKNVMDTARDSLDHMFEKLKVWPAQRWRTDIIYQAKYEMRAFQQGWRTPEGVLDKKEADMVVGWIDFLSGIPFGAVEMLVAITEAGTEPKDLPVKPGKGPAPPVPEKFFKGQKREYVLFNHIWLVEKGVKAMAPPVAAGEQTDNLWWLRVNLKEEDLYPFPGEFVGLAVRLFPNLPWGEQESSPYLFSGNWMDTLYYTSGIVKEVIQGEDHDEYVIKWRGQEIRAKSSDFATYKRNDRVVALKNVTDSRPTQRFDDEDTEKFNAEDWAIVPVTFYGVGLE